MDELEAIRDACPGPCAVVGDFNLILDDTDKNNPRINRRNMSLFRRVVDSLELRDMYLHGRLYTWSNERSNPTLVKLDRLLASLDWEELFPYCFLEALSSDISDHCPILMHSNAALIKTKPRFHFESY
jgi:exonuclease III